MVRLRCVTNAPQRLLLQIESQKHFRRHANTATGIAVRLYQLGIEMRPLFTRNTWWVYPVYASIGGSFGYYLQGVESRQLSYLSERRDALAEKRRRRAERDAAAEA